MLALAGSASADTFCVQKLDCVGVFEANLTDALASATGTVGRDRIELGAYIDSGTPVVAVNNPVDIVGSGDSSTLQGGGGNSTRLKVQEPTSTVSSIRIVLTADNSTGLETKGGARDITVTGDAGATDTLVGVLLTGAGSLDRARIFLPMTAGATIEAVRTESDGVATISNATIEGAAAIKAVNFGAPARTVVSDVFLRGQVGINANGSEVSVANAEVEAPAATGAVGLSAFNAPSRSAAIRARHVRSWVPARRARTGCAPTTSTGPARSRPRSTSRTRSSAASRPTSG